jgi:L-fuconolactonase
MNAHHRQARTYSMADALVEMATTGVDAALLHPPSTLPKSNAMAIDAARVPPDKFAILGHFDIANPTQRGLVETSKQQPGMPGFRFTFNQPAQRGCWDDSTLD